LAADNLSNAPIFFNHRTDARHQRLPLPRQRKTTAGALEEGAADSGFELVDPQ
jgi:hypothetical protein